MKVGIINKSTNTFFLEKISNQIFFTDEDETQVIKICDVIFYDGKAISVELPNFLTRLITYTEPAVKGDTTSGKVMKPAKINTGLELMVPLFCETGDKIEIDTRSLEYKNRVK